MIDLDGACPPSSPTLGELADNVVVGALYATLTVATLALEGANAARNVWTSFGEWYLGQR